MKYLYTILSFFICLNFSAALVSFSVDMNNYTGVINSVQINGTFNSFCGTCNPMTETSPGSGVYEVTIELPAGDIEYKFTVNAVTDDEYYETLTEGSPCTVSAFGFTNRFLAIGAEDITLDTACFEACEACDDVLPNYVVNFRVDMSEYTGPAFTTVEAFGSFNGFCGGCAPMSDDDGDDIYELAITLQEGTYEYLFALDINSVIESFADGDPCTSTIDGFVNRTLDATADVELDAVCWNECEACGVSSITELSQDAFSLFPNPSDGMIQIKSGSADLSDFELLTVYALSGQSVMTQRLNTSNSDLIDLSSLKSGVYMIELSSEKYFAIQSIVIK